MKKIVFILSIFMVLGLFWTSCQKEANFSGITVEVSGKILNDRGNGLEGALLELGEEKTYSDANGNFNIKVNDIGAKNRALLKVSLAGYMGSSYSFLVENGKNYKTTLILKGADGTTSFTVSTGGNITLSSGASAVIPANGVTLKDGSAYTGTHVNISVQEINEEKGIIFSPMIPGNTLTAEDINGNTQELYSYGMLKIELTGDNGEQLQLTQNQTASLTFSIPTSQLSSAPSTIPLWYFDETKGIWQEEGFATKQGNTYIGNVNHFSTWNCDAPHPPCTITGCIEDDAGNPFTYKVIQVGQVLTITDENGCFSTPIPAQFLPISVTYPDYSQMTSCILYNLNNIVSPNSNYNVGTLTYVSNCGGLQSSWQVTLNDILVIPFNSIGNVDVIVTDGTGQSVPNVSVEFSITNGGGSLNISQTTTDTSGLVSALWTTGSTGTQTLHVLVGSQTYAVEARKAVMGTMIDSRDGTLYETVTYPNGQTWLAENLRYNASGSWINSSNPNIKYGRLYDWYTMMAGASGNNNNPSGVQGICPSGWHIPSDLEWQELEIILGLNPMVLSDLRFRGTNQGLHLKSIDGWNSNGNGTNNSLFNALPAGYCQNAGFPLFYNLGINAYFWSTSLSATLCRVRILSNLEAKISRASFYRADGISCRCVKD